MMHPFQVHIPDRHVLADEFRSNIVPNREYLLVNANPCQLCGLLPQHHTCNHVYQPKFQGACLPAPGHQKYSPQKEYLGIVSESYYKNYELLMEPENQVNVNVKVKPQSTNMPRKN
jgi:hypothetical protein